MNNKVTQGDIFIVFLNDTLGCEQTYNSGRPALILQNNVGNTYSKTTIIAPLTKKTKKDIPTHYLLKKSDYPFLEYDSLVLGEQIRCVDIKSRFLERKIGKISDYDLCNILKVIDKNFH